MIYACDAMFAIIGVSLSEHHMYEKYNIQRARLWIHADIDIDIDI